ncbi:hypothetical protein BRN76_00550, partial [Xanthomonas oryzae pv. oryzae]
QGWAAAHGEQGLSSAALGATASCPSAAHRLTLAQPRLASMLDARRAVFGDSQDRERGFDRDSSLVRRPLMGTALLLPRRAAVAGNASIR